MTRLSIAFITADDPLDKRSWSGTNHFLYKTLQESIGDVHILGPYTPQPLWFFCSAFNFLTMRLLKKRFDYRHSSLMRKAYGRYFTAKLRQGNYNCVVVSASVAAAAGIQTSLPVFYINDRVIPGAIGYHEIFKNLFAFSKNQSIASDKLAIEKSTLSLFCSDWAADAAVEHHGISREKVKVLPFGANIETTPDFSEKKAFPEYPVKLLFVGVNWKTKGGAIALQCLQELIAKGTDAELTVAGCHPPENVSHPKMKVVGFLNKNKPEEFATLNSLFADSHFFILPTQFEAYGLVFCEAAAFGIPALAPWTGGIPSIIEDGVTGFLLDKKATGGMYADKILALVNQPEEWHKMRRAARSRYEEKLNWKSWAKSLKSLLNEKGIKTD